MIVFAENDFVMYTFIMNITVCEYNNNMEVVESIWKALVEHCKSQQSEIVLLPEMPFSSWLAHTDQVDESLWAKAVETHAQWLERLGELEAQVVLSSRPVIRDGVRLNEGYAWTPEGYQSVHHKVYLPNEPGYWEATWYSPGAEEFNVIDMGGIKIGFLICTELWFSQRAREYMKQGIDLLVCPRATEAQSLDKWYAGGRTAAVVSGAYCLSSNLAGADSQGNPFAGGGWIIEPDSEILGKTSTTEPFLTLNIDIEKARAAKSTYPRDVIDEF